MHSRAVMAKLHVFDSYLEVANRWLKELSEQLALSPEHGARALHALRAGLHAIRDRLPDAEVIDLGAQLPTVIRGVYYEGWTHHHQPKQIRDRAAMIARVQAELPPDHQLDPVGVLRAVIHLVVQHVSEGQVEHVIATLPKSLAALWHDLTGQPLASSSPPKQVEADLRHTGYRR